MRVPILMYHAVPDALGAGLSPMHVALPDFTAQLRWLAEAGYCTISLDQLMAAYTTGASIPARSVVLTFDDGYRSLLLHATPILQELGFTATLFVTTGAVGLPSYDALAGVEGHPAQDPPLSWAELGQLQQSGCWILEAHGRHHLVHNTLSQEALWQEMAGAAQDLYEHLGIRARYYAYPYGRYNTRCLQLLPQLGYVGACSVHTGLAHAGSDARRLPRVGITGQDTLATFQTKVTTGHARPAERVRAQLLAPVFHFPQVKDALKSVHDYFMH